jgi:predicted short-subunit dehydrogenase-like oxidoreductase (DUF2520 family)
LVTEATGGTVNRTAPPRLGVGIVGTGRAGAVIGAAFDRVGHRVLAASGLSAASVSRSSELLPGVPLLDPADVASNCDLVVLAVPDDALPDLVAGLAEVGAFRPGSFVMHLAGRYGIKVLEPATNMGVYPLAIHPAMTLTGTSLDLARIDGAPFAVTTTEELRAVAEALVVEIGGEPWWVSEDARLLYHAALAGSANHLMSLVSQTLELLSDAGINDPARLIAPLLNASLDNALRLGDAALTGPVARGDAATVAAHLDALRDAPMARRTYIALARLTADRALQAGLLSAQDAEPLLAVLGDERER